MGTSHTAKGFTAIDLNLKTVTIFDGSETRGYETRFIEALSKKASAEELQKEYPKRWRHTERILNRVREFCTEKQRTLLTISTGR